MPVISDHKFLASVVTHTHAHILSHMNSRINTFKDWCDAVKSGGGDWLWNGSTINADCMKFVNRASEDFLFPWDNEVYEDMVAHIECNWGSYRGDNTPQRSRTIAKYMKSFQCAWEEYIGQHSAAQNYNGYNGYDDYGYGGGGSGGSSLGDYNNGNGYDYDDYTGYDGNNWRNRRRGCCGGADSDNCDDDERLDENANWQVGQ